MGNKKTRGLRLSVKLSRKRKCRHARAAKLQNVQVTHVAAQLDLANASGMIPIAQSSEENTDAYIPATRPKKLSALCKNVIKKYKLQTKNKIESNPKLAIVEPESSTIIGGKPLRDRTKISSERASLNEASTSSNPPKRRKLNKTVADLKPKSKKKENPAKRLPNIDVVKERKVKPHTECNLDMLFRTIKVNPENQVRIKEEPEPTADNQDPLAPEDEDYTVIFKEEFEADEDTTIIDKRTLTREVPVTKVIVPTLTVASTSSSLPSATSGPPLMTVVADDMQIFANNIAAQLREFPLNRALLLQLEIQTMIDNERQLLLH